MRVTLWGARGTVPVPEAAAAGEDCLAGGPPGILGGNTPCVELCAPGGQRLILDAGMGIHWLGVALLANGFGGGEEHAHVLITHAHWGHIQGVPFFPPMLVPGNRVTFYGRGSCGRSLGELLVAQMDRVYCPVPNALADDVGAIARVRELRGDELEIGPFQITAAPVNHAPGTVCLAYRVACGGAVVAYLPDVEYVTDEHFAAAVELARDADLVLHDAHFTVAEYPAHRGQGHASEADAVRLAEAAGASHLLLFHHHPDRRSASEYTVPSTVDLDVAAACEGAAYSLAGRGARRASR